MSLLRRFYVKNIALALLVPLSIYFLRNQLYLGFILGVLSNYFAHEIQKYGVFRTFVLLEPSEISKLFELILEGDLPEVKKTCALMPRVNLQTMRYHGLSVLIYAVQARNLDLVLYFLNDLHFNPNEVCKGQEVAL